MTREEQIAKLTELLDEDWHTIQFNRLGWTVGHPITERIDGSLFDCQVTWDGSYHVNGRFKLNNDGTLGEL